MEVVLQNFRWRGARSCMWVKITVPKDKWKVLHGSDSGQIEIAGSAHTARFLHMMMSRYTAVFTKASMNIIVQEASWQPNGCWEKNKVNAHVDSFWLQAGYKKQCVFLRDNLKNTFLFDPKSKARNCLHALLGGLLRASDFPRQLFLCSYLGCAP